MLPIRASQFRHEIDKLTGDSDDSQAKQRESNGKRYTKATSNEAWRAFSYSKSFLMQTSVTQITFWNRIKLFRSPVAGLLGGHLPSRYRRVSLWTCSRHISHSDQFELLDYGPGPSVHHVRCLMAPNDGYHAVCRATKLWITFFIAACAAFSASQYAYIYVYKYKLSSNFFAYPSRQVSPYCCLLYLCRHACILYHSDGQEICKPEYGFIYIHVSAECKFVYCSVCYDTRPSSRHMAMCLIWLEIDGS